MADLSSVDESRLCCPHCDDYLNCAVCGKQVDPADLLAEIDERLLAEFVFTNEERTALRQAITIGLKSQAEAAFKHRCHPVPNGNGFAFLTWEDALKAAHEGIDTAYEYRRRVVVAAHDAGLSYRTIGAAIGISAAGVHRIVVGKNVRGGRSPSERQEQLLREASSIPSFPEPLAAEAKR